MRDRPNEGAAVDVRPPRVELGGSRRSARLSLRNLGSRPARIEVSAHAWEQDERGAVRLTPTRELRLSPAAVELGPGDERRIRVGADLPGPTRERAYRVLVEQRPHAPSAGGIWTPALGVPVFVAPVRPFACGLFEDASLSGRRLTFSIRSSGNVRLELASIRITALDGGGGLVFEREERACPILAGDRRVFDVDLPAGCATVVLDTKGLTRRLVVGT